MGKAITTPEELEQAEIEHRMHEKDFIEVVRWIMDNPMGRAFFWDLLKDCGIFRSTLGDHSLMSFNEGKRVIGLKQFTRLQSDPKMRELFSQMQKENAK